MEPIEELAQQNQLLRERISQLEQSVARGIDPVMRALLEQTPSFLNVVTPEGRSLATGRASESFGSVVGRSIFEFIEPRDHAVARDALAEACRTGRPVSYECMGYGEDGEPHHVYLVRAVPVLKDGTVHAIVLVPTDITERVRLERKTVESEQAMRLAVDAARMGLWRWDMRRNEVSWDARLLEIVGLESAPVDYEAYLQLIHPEDRALVASIVTTARETGEYRTFEHRLAKTAEFGDRWLLATGTVIKDMSGRFTVMLGGALEITAQKKLAEQMQRAERVESLGQLTAGIAHNFNNLLAAIMPNVELALADAPEPHQQALTAALDASLQARDLVKSLMSLAGRRRPAHEPCDPKDVVKRLETICKLTFPKQILIRAHIDPEVRFVVLPATDLEQVLLNLLLNARDAVLEQAKGERRIEVRMDRVVTGAGGRQTRIRVHDTGIGMSEAVRQQIFIPFFTTKAPQRGSGLGLASALTRVRSVAGQLECESLLGAGTTFTLLLPEVEAVTLPPGTASPTSAPAFGGAEAILIIDDEAAVRSIVARLLRSQRYEVLEAASAADARLLLTQDGSRVRLILLDQSMPRESGLEALPSLRSLCAAPVVLFTGCPAELPPTVAGLLEKPARPEELFRIVRTTLEAARQSA